MVRAYGDNGIRHVCNNVRPIETPADFAGIKLRTPPDPVTIQIFAALGSMLIPWQKREGYPPAFSAAVTASSPVIAGLIPPSIPLISYATVSNVDLSIGLFTPPIGTTLVVSAAIARQPIGAIVKELWPVYLGALSALLLISCVSALTLS